MNGTIAFEAANERKSKHFFLSFHVDVGVNFSCLSLLPLNVLNRIKGDRCLVTEASWNIHRSTEN